MTRFIPRLHHEASMYTCTTRALSLFHHVNGVLRSSLPRHNWMKRDFHHLRLCFRFYVRLSLLIIVLLDL